MGMPYVSKPPISLIENLLRINRIAEGSRAYWRIHPIIIIIIIES